MLKNPSFENGHHAIAIGNCPNAWTLHWLDGERPPGFDRAALAPEIQVPSKADIPQHEHDDFFIDGDHCVKVFKTAPVWFALSQRVSGLTPGAVYRFTAPVHLDVFRIPWPGYKDYPEIGEWAAEARAGLGDSWDTVDWADWQAPEHGTLEYGEYGEVVLEFVADDDGTVTLWLECKAKWGDKSNNFFFDAFSLICTEDPPPTGRTYERTYVLLPQDATWDEVVEQLTEHYADKRTIGYSADDAFVNPLEVTERTVIVPYDRFPGNIVEFMEQYYPGAHIILEGEPVEPPPPPQRLTRGHYGPHIQGMVQPALDYIARVKPPVVKIFGAGDAYRVKEASPHTAVVFRRWLDAGAQSMLRDHPDKHQAARDYMAMFNDVFTDVVPNLAALYPDQECVLYVESINEEYECNHPKNRDTADFDIAFIEEVAALGLPVRCSVFTAAQGNPEIEGPDLDILLNLARVAEQHGALCSYHNYWGANIDLPPGTLLESAWPWSPGRWQIFDRYFADHGVYVTWFGGESGPCTSSDGVHLDPGGGWRASGCHAGNVSRLVDEIMLHEDFVSEWNIENGDRFLGSVGFTDGSDWDMFLYGAAWYAIGDVMMWRYG